MVDIKLLNSDEGVSPVIGVILMVAITVILAAVIGFFATNLGDDLSGGTAESSVLTEKTSTGYVLRVQSIGDGVQELQVNVGGSQVATLTQVGEQVDVTAPDDTDINIVQVSEGGDSTSINSVTVQDSTASSISVDQSGSTPTATATPTATSTTSPTPSPTATPTATPSPTPVSSSVMIESFDDGQFQADSSHATQERPVDSNESLFNFTDDSYSGQAVVNDGSDQAELRYNMSSSDFSSYSFYTKVDGSGSSLAVSLLNEAQEFGISVRLGGGGSEEFIVTERDPYNTINTGVNYKSGDWYKIEFSEMSNGDSKSRISIVNKTTGNTVFDQEVNARFNNPAILSITTVETGNNSQTVDEIEGELDE